MFPKIIFSVLIEELKKDNSSIDTLLGLPGRLILGSHDKGNCFSIDTNKYILYDGQSELYEMSIWQRIIFNYQFKKWKERKELNLINNILKRNKTV